MNLNQAVFMEISDSDQLFVAKGLEENNKFLLVSGLPLNEPIAAYGPFVMNTTPWQAYFGLGKLDFGLGSPILDWQPDLGLATQSWTKIPLIRIYQFKFVVSIITLNCTF